MKWRPFSARLKTVDAVILSTIGSKQRSGADSQRPPEFRFRQLRATRKSLAELTVGHDGERTKAPATPLQLSESRLSPYSAHFADEVTAGCAPSPGERCGVTPTAACASTKYATSDDTTLSSGASKSANYRRQSPAAAMSVESHLILHLQRDEIPLPSRARSALSQEKQWKTILHWT